MVRTNQGGSILSFLVIGGVMVLLLVGGAYALRRFIVPSDGSGLISRQDENETKTETPDKTTNEPPKDTESTKNEDKEADVDGSGSGQVQQPTETPAEKETAVNGNPATGNLPATGPEDMVLQGILISSLVAFAAVYLRSRQAAASL
jgi:hypothetical protein